MLYRKLGKTDLKISVIGIGTYQFGGEWGQSFNQQEVDAILDRAQELGINFIDTAECYGDHLAEQLVGNYISKNRREDFVIATKFGHHFNHLFDRNQEWSPAQVLNQLEESLRSLQTDYIDLYQFHSGTDEVFDNDELWTMLDKQKQAGKIRHLGTSIGKNNNIHQTAASTKVGSEAIQVVYNRLDRVPEEQVFPACIEQNLGVLARVPLASGYLSGKYTPGTVFADNDVRHRHDQELVARRLQEVQKIREYEVPADMNMATWALAWCLKHPAVTAVIPGCKSPVQVEANSEAAKYAPLSHPQAWVN